MLSSVASLGWVSCLWWGRYQSQQPKLCSAPWFPVLTPLVHLHCRTTAAFSSVNCIFHPAIFIQAWKHSRMKATAVVYLIIRIFECLFLDFLKVCVIIQAEILPWSSLVSDRLFEGIRSLVLDGTEGGEGEGIETDRQTEADGFSLSYPCISVHQPGVWHSWLCENPGSKQWPRSAACPWLSTSSRQMPCLEGRGAPCGLQNSQHS